MWGNDTINDEGGFNVTITQSSPAVTNEVKQNTVISVAIRELLSNDEENKNIHVVVVGIVKQVEIQSLKNMFTLEDNTGRLLCIQWGDENELSRSPKLVENVYFKVVGSKRIQNDKVTLLCHSVRPLETLNELTHHLLSIIALPYQNEELNMATNMQQTHNRVDLPLNGVHSNDAFLSTNNDLQLNPKELRVYTVIKQCQDEAGYTATDILKILPEKMPLPEVEKILMHFIEEGHIFSTIDENHFKVTDFGG